MLQTRFSFPMLKEGFLIILWFFFNDKHWFFIIARIFFYSQRYNLLDILLHSINSALAFPPNQSPCIIICSWIILNIKRIFIETDLELCSCCHASNIPKMHCSYLHFIFLLIIYYLFYFIFCSDLHFKTTFYRQRTNMESC